MKGLEENSNLQLLGESQPGNQTSNQSCARISKRELMPQTGCGNSDGDWRRMGIWKIVFTNGSL